MDDVIYDLCIVGAGMFGSAAARHASAVAGVKVCLVGSGEPTPSQRSSREIFGAHYDEGRITRYFDRSKVNVLLSRESIKRYRELEELSGIPFYHPAGCLSIAQKNNVGLKKMINGANSLNVSIIDLSYNDIFQRRFPYVNLKDDDYPLFDDCGAGHISPRRMVLAQIKVAGEQGCSVISKVVNEVTPLENGMHKIITDDGKVIKAKRVLICAGSFTNLKTFPIPKLKIRIHKETAALFKLPNEEAQRLSAMPCIIYNRPDEGRGAYILPPIKYSDGHYYLKAGPLDAEESGFIQTLEEVRNWYLSKGDPLKIETLTKLLTELLPGLRYDEVTDVTCALCYSPTDKPYIDRISPTVTVAAVGNGKGAKFSDEVGRISAMLSLTGRWESELPKSHFQAIKEEDTAL